MIIFEIDSLATVRKEGISKKDGKPFVLVFQQASVHGHMKDGFPARFPRDTTIQLDDKNPKPYPAGKYVLAADSYRFGDFDRFVFGRLSLQPIASFMADIERLFCVSITRNSPKPA